METKFLISLLAGVILLCACKGKTRGNYEVANADSSSDLQKKDSIIQEQPKLIKTAEIRFKVKNVQQTAEHIAKLTVGMGGIVVHQQLSSTVEHSLDVRISNDSVMQVKSYYTTDNIVVKVPYLKLEEFMTQITHMGIYVNSLTMDITDKSLDYLSDQLKLKTRTELIGQQQRGRVIIKKPEDVLNLKDDIIDKQISNQQINNAVKTSVITLSFYESNAIKKETIVNDDPSAYNLSFVKRLGMAFENGWDNFEDLLINLTNLWVFVLLAIGCWALYTYYKNKKPVTI